MARLIWAAPALADLDEIAEYIALDDRPAAIRYVRKVFETVDRLKQFPSSGRRPAELPDTRYREVVVPPCRVFYRQERDRVFILYIMRSERLLRTHLLEQGREHELARTAGTAGRSPVLHEPAENIPLTDVYVCGVMEPDDPAAPLPKLRWSLFADQPPAAAVGMPVMGGAGDYHTICGPVLARTTSDTLLMFAEGRHDSRDDFGNIDAILRRSNDSGATWSDIQVVHRNGAGQVGNTCPIVDYDTARIHLLTCTGVQDEMEILTGSSYREVWHSFSDDDGATWSGRRNISAMARRDGWYWYATGPAAGIQIRSGEYRRRLVAPANHSYLLPGGGYEYACHALYSDDGGDTWRIGTASEPGGNENQIAEAGENLLIQDIRLQTNRTGCRAYRYSRDGGATWDAMQSDPRRPCTRCQGSIISLDQRPNGTHNILVASNPAPVGRRLDLGRRERLVARVSTDGGRTWPRRLVVEPSYAGYSTLIEIDGERVGIAYDRHPRLSYRTFYLEDCT